MFKRAIWTGIGYGLGVGSSVYVQHKVKKTVEATVERYTPAHIRDEALARGKDAAQRLRDGASDAIAVARNGSDAVQRGADAAREADASAAVEDAVEHEPRMNLRHRLDLRDSKFVKSGPFRPR